MKTPILVILALELAGCASSPKTPATTSHAKTARFEFRTLTGFDAEDSPEAKKLEEDGYICTGRGWGDMNEAEDYGLVSEKAGPVAVFKRPYQPDVTPLGLRSSDGFYQYQISLLIKQPLNYGSRNRITAINSAQPVSGDTATNKFEQYQALLKIITRCYNPKLFNYSPPH